MIIWTHPISFLLTGHLTYYGLSTDLWLVNYAAPNLWFVFYLCIDCRLLTAFFFFAFRLLNSAGRSRSLQDLRRQVTVETAMRRPRRQNVVFAVVRFTDTL